MPSITWAYEYSDKDLIDNFFNTCLDAGSSGSPAVFDPAFSCKMKEAIYIKGVLAARLKKATPPFRRDDFVMVLPGVVSNGLCDRSWNCTKLDSESGPKKIFRIYYESLNGKDRWHIQFEDNGPKFNAKDFELASANQSPG